MKFAASAEPSEVYKELGTKPEGLTQEEVNASRVGHGVNSVSTKDKHSTARRFSRAFLNVFSIALFCYAILDIILCGLDAESDGSIIGTLVAGFLDDKIFITIIVSLILISGTVSFIQDTRNSKIADKLLSMVSTTITVRRDWAEAEIDSMDLVVGDIIIMDSGDMVPADVRIVESNHLKIDQSALTGESDEITKNSKTVGYPKSILECENLAFMGTVITGGSAVAVVVNVGDDTVFGQMAGNMSAKRPRNAYEMGTASVVRLLLTIMVCLIPPVLIISICKQFFMVNHGVFDISCVIEPLKYAIALAVGLMPEMLSTIITANLAKGSIAMAKKKVIVKDMTSVQSLGSIDVLCSDKTGTLTQNRISVSTCCDVFGNPSNTVALYSSLNAANLTSSTNQIDWAIDEYAEETDGLKDEMEGYEFVNDIPFDFVRRRATVVMKRTSDDMQFVYTKGALQELLAISTSYIDENRDIQPLTDDQINSVIGLSEWYSTKGMRVLGVAYKPILDGSKISSEDECDFVFVGFIVFTDPVKPTAGAAIKSMAEYGISVKVLTGDNEFVTKHICDEIGIKTKPIARLTAEDIRAEAEGDFDVDAGTIIVGSEIDKLSDEDLVDVVEKNNVFARLTPDNKARIVSALRTKGHTVGMLGDGINDTVALRQADVGISVDTGADIAKESADLILLEKDLGVLKEGAIMGRSVYANACKYVKMIGGINFGYMFSLIAASLLFDFEVIGPLQILVFNLINDCACIFIAFDNVEDEYVRAPRNWDPKNLRTVFMGWGPMCCVTDAISWTFFVFVVLPATGLVGSGWDMFTGGVNVDNNPTAVYLFESLWFIEQFWMQVWAIHIVRNNKIPFFQSWSAPILVATTIIALVVGTVLPFTPVGDAIVGYDLNMAGLIGPIWWVMLIMPVIAVIYFTISHLAKLRIIRKHGFFAC